MHDDLQKHKDLQIHIRYQKLKKKHEDAGMDRRVQFKF